MTYTTQIKEEITKDFQNVPEELTAVCTYLHFNSALQNNTLSVTIINASVARWVFKNLKEIYFCFCGNNFFRRVKFGFNPLFFLKSLRVPKQSH